MFLNFQETHEGEKNARMMKLKTFGLLCIKFYACSPQEPTTHKSYRFLRCTLLIFEPRSAPKSAVRVLSRRQTEVLPTYVPHLGFMTLMFSLERLFGSGEGAVLLGRYVLCLSFAMVVGKLPLAKKM